MVLELVSEAEYPVKAEIGGYMVFALALALLASTPVGSPANPPGVARLHDDPPIQVSLSSDNTFVRGQKARVYIRVAEDGYVVVLRADAEGRVRVLFPIDPSDDAAAPGGRKFEVRARGDREAFTVDDAGGTGVVLAAWSATPFTFDGLVRGDHWDLNALGAQQSDAARDRDDADSDRNDADSEGNDAAGNRNSPNGEAALVAVVQSMAGENQFDYDVATYTVQSVTAYNGGSSDRGSYDGGSYYDGPYSQPYYGPRYGGLSLSLGFGSHWRYGRVGIGPFCDGFYWSAWGCGPFYDPFYYPVYRPYVYRPYSRSYVFGGSRFGRTYRQPFIGGNRSSYGSGQPRLRIPTGGGFSSGYSRGGYMRGRTGTRVSPPASRGFRDGGFARPGFAPRGDRVRGSAPSARSAPSGGSSRGGWGSAAPRSSGPGYSRGGGGGYSRSGAGGGGRREGGGGGGRRR
jgi:hypothetical protein